jgi:cobalt-zinc-cadmium efflux system outer membrane protein
MIGPRGLAARRPPAVVLLLAAALTAGGCASVPRDAGIADVQRMVSERGGQPLEWDPGAPISAPASDEAVLSQLAGELSVERAVEVALANNRGLRATLEELGIARADLIAASTVRNPVFDFEIHFPGEPFRPYEAAVTKTLVDLLRLRGRRAAGRAAFEAARAQVAGSVLAFAAGVRRDYYELQAAQQVLAQQRTVAEAAAAAAELAMGQHRAGNVTDLDLEREQARYESAKLDLARAEVEEIAARERLVADLGLLGPVPLALPAPELPAGEERSAEEVEAALGARLDVEMARAEVESARRALPIARGAAVDDLEVGVHWDRESGGEHSRGPTATIPIPLFDRGLAGRARAVSTLRRAEQRLWAAEVGARAAARAARERLLEARARAEYLRDVVVPRRQRILALTQLEYHAMQRGPYDVLAARQELADAERRRVLALRDYWAARTGLDAVLSGAEAFAGGGEAALASGRSGSGDAGMGEPAAAEH